MGKKKLTPTQRKEKNAKFEAQLAARKGITSLPVVEGIPQDAPRINAELDSTFSDCYRLVFKHYNNDICDVYKINNKSETKQIFSTLNKITEYGPANKAKLVKNSVKKDGQYKALYDGLEDDIIIEEVEYNSSGRIFCYFVKSFCCVIAIRTNHLEKKRA